jgi:hypothetical protein
MTLIGKPCTRRDVSQWSLMIAQLPACLLHPQLMNIRASRPPLDLSKHPRQICRMHSSFPSQIRKPHIPAKRLVQHVDHSRPPFRLSVPVNVL